MHDTPLTYEAGRVVSAEAIARSEQPRLALHEHADTINVRLEQLEKLLGSFAQRLEPVLTPSRPEPAPALVADRSEDGSWLGDYLAATARRLDSTIEGFARLLTRVEL